MPFVTRKLLPLLLRYLAVCLIVAVVTLALQPLHDSLGIQVTALIYLLPVILATYLWGLGPGILAGLASFFIYNYFFLPPYHTLLVHQTQDIITLVVFLSVAAVISQLIGQIKAGIRLARSREWEATRMYTLISALAGLQDVPAVAGLLSREALETFGARRVEVVVEGQSQSAGQAASGPPSLTQVMQTARRAEGELRLWLDGGAQTQEETRLLATFASQGALAIERIRLSRSETRARILEETDRAKSSLLSSVSHELRSPLSAIKASASSLASGMVDWESEARGDLLATIEEETDHLNYLVGNLLDMSRIEAGALKPRRQWNTLAEIAGSAANRLRKTLKDYRVALDFPADLPLAPVDYVLIEQVFTNLLSNSAKFAPPGSLIRIAARPEQDALHVRVTNSGPAVPDKDLERIFDKFNTVTVSDRVTSTGLGLSICKGIVEAHEGRIWAENLPGGIVFHFTLPARLDGLGPEIPAESE